jgi:hypothetical protein
MHMKKITLLMLVFTASIFSSAWAQEGRNAYMRALSDLRGARWMIDHRTGNWQANEDEMAAVRKIDDAINEIKRAAIDDGRDMYYHPQMDEHNDHGGRLHDAMDLLRRARNDIEHEEEGFGQGLRNRAIMHIDEAIRFTDRALESGRFNQQAPPPMQNNHPAYLTALSDLRAARWMIDHRTGDWRANEDEMGAVRKIDDAINELKRAAIDDGKDIYFHPQIQERNDHGGRLHDAMDLLRRARADIEHEDEGYGQGLRNRAFMHIDEAIRFTDRAIAAGGFQQQAPPPPPIRNDHPFYIAALQDLRAARWLLEHVPGDWRRTEDEFAAVRKIDDAMNEIIRAAINDGKGINDHIALEEHREHDGRLGQALEYLRRAREDVSRDADNGYAQGLKNRAFMHIDEAIRLTERARHQ